MNKKAYYRLLTELEHELKEGAFQAFMEVVDIFSEVNNVVTNIGFEAFTPASSQSQNNNAPDRERAKVASAIKSAVNADKADTNYMVFAENFFSIKSYINKFQKESGVLTNNINILLTNYLKLMDEFSSEFGDYRKDFSTHKVYAMSFTAQKLEYATNNLQLVIGTVLDSYRHNSPNEGEAQIELYLSNIISTKHFGIKFIVLDELYKDICNLFDVSFSDSPLIIEYIENGSLLTRVAGHALVVGILTTILEASAPYYINKYTSNGEMVKLNETVLVLEKMFGLSEKLKEQGHDVDEIEQTIHQSLKKIAKSMDTLLSDQPTIEVNDQVFELNDENKTKLIEESKLKLLEHKEFTQEA